MIRVVLPAHLRTLANADGEVTVNVTQPTLGSVLDALEETYPVLRGTIRDHVTLKRRPFVRQVLLARVEPHERPDLVLPDAVVRGAEPFLVVGAMAGG